MSVGGMFVVLLVFSQFQMKLVDALGVVGVISRYKAVCHDSGVESVDAVKRRRGLDVCLQMSVDASRRRGVVRNTLSSPSERDARGESEARGG